MQEIVSYQQMGQNGKFLFDPETQKIVQVQDGREPFVLGPYTRFIPRNPLAEVYLRTEAVKTLVQFCRQLADEERINGNQQLT